MTKGNMILQQLVNGLTLGSLYALIALGYTMVYGVLLMINFAHSEIFMVGAFASLLCYLKLATFLPVWLNDWAMAGFTKSPLIA